MQGIVSTLNLFVVLYFLIWILLIGLTIASVYFFATGRKALGWAFGVVPLASLILSLLSLIFGKKEDPKETI